MANMSEDALFKAVLRNKPGTQPAQQQPQAAPKPEVPVKKEPVRNSGGPGSEDAMYRALLRNKPQQQYSPPSKPVPAKPVAPAPVRDEVKPVVQTMPVETHQTPRTMITDEARQTERIVESLNRLNISVNQIHTLLKNVIVPILALTVIIGIGIAILIKI